MPNWLYLTKGYGITRRDIDWSCPADLEPYAKAHKREFVEVDAYVHGAIGMYMTSAIAYVIDHCLNGRKARAEYPKSTITDEAFRDYGLTEDEINERELKKMLLAEEAWIINDRRRGLPDTILAKKR